jgi:hypothetical protein
VKRKPHAAPITIGFKAVHRNAVPLKDNRSQIMLRMIYFKHLVDKPQLIAFR